MSHAQRPLWLLVAAWLAVAALWGAALVQRPLFNPDEGRYAEIPREMAVSGAWVVPTLNGVAYIEKPPLHYWLTALVYRVFGVHAWTARLFTTLAALGSALGIALLTRHWLSAAGALRAACMTLSMGLFAVMGQLLTLDMSLTFFMTLALCAFLRAQSGSSALMLLAWGAIGFGTLVKGPIAALIPALALVAYSLIARDFKPWRRLNLGWGVLLFLLITAPWHLSAQRALSDFYEFFFWHEHVARFATPEADRQEPWWYFLAVFGLGTLPWTPAALRALVSKAHREPSAEFSPELFLKCWIVCILVFFSISHSKLAPYLLPALPAAAMLIASRARVVPRFGLAASATAAVVLGAAVAAGAAMLPMLLRGSARAVYFLAMRTEFYIAGILMLVSGLMVLLARRLDLTAAIATLSAGWLAAVLVLLLGATALAPIYSGVTLVPSLAGAATEGVGSDGADSQGVRLYSVGTYDQTLPFYLRRRVILVSYRGEMDYGLRRDPSAWIATLAEFKSRWQRERRAFAIMDLNLWTQLQHEQWPMREIARDAHRVVLAKR